MILRVRIIRRNPELPTRIQRLRGQRGGGVWQQDRKQREYSE